MKQTLIARAIIKQGDKVLILRRAKGNPLYIGQYELPGGKVEFGEDPRASLQREIAEEIGCEIETIQLYDVYSELDVRDLQHQYIELVFLATLKPSTGLKLDEDHDKYSWKKASDMQLLDLTETTRLALQIEPASKTTEVVANSDVVNTPIHEVIIYADGASRGNPGPSASGFVIKDAQERTIFSGGEYIGLTTNNQAEYQAVKFALQKALQLGARSVKLRLDSLLVVNQLNGIYQIKNRDLWSIHEFIKDLIGKFESVAVSHIRREYNKEADGMANKLLDEQRA